MTSQVIFTFSQIIRKYRNLGVPLPIPSLCDAEKSFHQSTPKCRFRIRHTHTQIRNLSDLSSLFWSLICRGLGKSFPPRWKVNKILLYTKVRYGFHGKKAPNLSDLSRSTFHLVVALRNSFRLSSKTWKLWSTRIVCPVVPVKATTRTQLSKSSLFL